MTFSVPIVAQKLLCPFCLCSSFSPTLEPRQAQCLKRLKLCVCARVCWGTVSLCRPGLLRTCSDPLSLGLMCAGIRNVCHQAQSKPRVFTLTLYRKSVAICAREAGCKLPAGHKVSAVLHQCCHPHGSLGVTQGSWGRLEAPPCTVAVGQSGSHWQRSSASR